VVLKEFSCPETTETGGQVSTVVNFPMQIISLRGDWNRNGEGCLIEETNRVDLNNNDGGMNCALTTASVQKEYKTAVSPALPFCIGENNSGLIGRLQVS